MENPQVHPVSPVVLPESEGSASSVLLAVELDQTHTDHELDQTSHTQLAHAWSDLAQHDVRV